MSSKVTILIGTMTGTAELVAEEVEPILVEAGHGVETLDMDGLDASVFKRGGKFLICTSTYGQGDVPDNAQALFDDLNEVRPDLSSVGYGIIGLGDSTYADSYNGGAKRFDTMLSELGAKRIGERFEHNASGDDLPEEAGAAWAGAWCALLAS
jgi:MioC protein